jgi:hypothetical protein
VPGRLLHERAAPPGEAGSGTPRPYWLDLLEKRDCVFAEGRQLRWLPRVVAMRAHASWQGSAMLEALNDVVAHHLEDIADERRIRWVASQRRAGVEREFGPDFIVRVDKENAAFLLVGDPGEGDDSQYAVVEPLRGVHKDEGSDFMVVVSDVIYPAGDINDYVGAFYIPYEDYRRPIYALPGNHDWYDGLNGFMFHFCGALPLAAEPYRRSSYGVRQFLARRLWQRPTRPDVATLTAYRDARPPWSQHPGWRPAQPGPYYAIDVGERLRLVAIDTGISGMIDDEQGRWLLRVSQGERAKVLLTGKPLLVNGEHRPCTIQWRRAPRRGERQNPGSVDEVVRDPDHNYVAAIGGDVHNYQSYRVAVGGEEGERTIEYVVSGGGGAFLSPTHPVPPGLVEPPPGIALRDGPVLYPDRAQSLAVLAGRFVRRAGFYAMVHVALLAFGAAMLMLALGLADHVPVDRAVYYALITVAVVPVAAVTAFMLGNYTFLNLAVRTFAIQLIGLAVAVGLSLWGIEEGLGAPGALFVGAGGFFATIGLVGLVYLTFRVGLRRLWRPWDWRAVVLDGPDRETRELDADRYVGALLAGVDPEGVSPEAERIFRIAFPAFGDREIFRSKIGEIADDDTPPFFKSFLHCEVRDDTLTIRCFGVPGDPVDDRQAVLVDTIGPIALT